MYTTVACGKLMSFHFCQISSLQRFWICILYQWSGTGNFYLSKVNCEHFGISEKLISWLNANYPCPALLLKLRKFVSFMLILIIVHHRKVRQTNVIGFPSSQYIFSHRFRICIIGQRQKRFTFQKWTENTLVSLSHWNHN